MSFSFEKLIVYQKAVDFADAILQCKDFSSQELIWGQFAALEPSQNVGKNWIGSGTPYA